MYLKYKNWDTGGYWSGPYTRAQWSSSIGSETIRIYEHSSYSEQYNNGIYLIQESSSSTPTVPDIQAIVNTGGSWNGVHSWASPTSETINGSVEYHYKLSFDTNSRIAYRTIDKTWYDANTSSQPSALSSDAFSTQSLALVNPQYVWIGDTSATNTTFYISFNNPHYEA